MFSAIGDDILGGMVRSSPSNAFKKTISFNPSNLADEEDPFLTKPNYAKSSTFTLPQQNFTSSSLSRKRPEDNKSILSMKKLSINAFLK